MTHSSRSCPSADITLRALLAALFLAVVLAPVRSARADDFVQPTKDELQMTSLPGYPGVAAVVLFHEEITKDDLHVVLHYDRIKVLTEEGKKYANVQLGYVSTTDLYDEVGNDKTLDQIQGRTIHPDGTIIPFTGKPYLKVIEKGENAKFQEKIFTLPDVEVGSIIEYRYATRINDNVYESPDWYIQGDLYVKAAHFVWYPTTHELVDSKQRVINTISWFPILPPGAQIQHRQLPASSGFDNQQQVYELTVKDVPPTLHEEYMPPTASFTYRVLFNFEPFTSRDEYWKSEGKDWSKRVNAFSNPNSDLRSATNAIIAGASTQDQKLRKIYAAIMTFENTDYTRARDVREDKASGLGRLADANDIFTRKRGTSTQLTELFVAMARAASMNADLMLVPDRSHDIFTEYWLSFNQFDDLIAIVNVDGKELFLDPGSRDCPYGHLAWQHTFVSGLRQKGGETAFQNTPGDDYKANAVFRVANLNMDATGTISGTIDLTFQGSPALRWRQLSLRGDEESLKHSLRTHLEQMLPASLEIKAVTIQNIDDYEQPLKVTYAVHGTLGSWTGKRLILPADIFEANAKAVFPHEKRDVSVYFHYPQNIRDALRINFPSTYSVEAAPSNAKFGMPQLSAYTMAVEPAATSFTTRRDFAFGTIIIHADEYPKLRSFYSQFEANDQQSVVLKTATPVAAASASPTGAPAN